MREQMRVKRDTVEELLTEVIQPASLGTILHEQGTQVVRGIVLAGQNSRNGYLYTETALREAVTCYEGKPVYLDHHTQSHEPNLRAPEDLVGVIESPRFEEGKVVGDIRVRESTSGRLFLSLVDRLLPQIGMSHVVKAIRSRDGRRVEKIVEVISVDVVRYPATTRTLRESVHWADDLHRLSSEEQEQGVELICEVHPPEEGSVALRDADLVLREEMDLLRRDLAFWKDKAEHLEQLGSQQARVDELLERSHLPNVAITPQFRRMLVEAHNDSAREELIRERRELISQLKVTSPVSMPRRGVEPGLRDAEIIGVIKGRR